jgi:hypothetical protein
MAGVPVRALGAGNHAADGQQVAGVGIEVVDSGPGGGCSRHEPIVHQHWSTWSGASVWMLLSGLCAKENNGRSKRSGETSESTEQLHMEEET